MSILSGAIGPTYTARSPIVDAERLVNWFPEITDGNATGQNQLAYYPGPGHRPFVTLPDSPVRGLFYQNGRCYAVAGSSFYTLTINGGYTQLGSVDPAFQPATMCSNGPNGHQVFIVTGGSSYIYDIIANTIVVLNPATVGQEGIPSPDVMGAFCDGYFLALEGGTNKFHISHLEDGMLWDALDVGQVSQSADLLVSMVVNQRQVVLFGQQTTTVWYNSGYATFPFQPIQGTFMQQGCQAPFSATLLDNSVYWLGTNESGGVVCYRLDNPPKRVSTHAVEARWAQYRSVTNAIGWSYQDQGHYFYVLYFPNGDVTWVYDQSTGLWHERALWDVNFERFVPDLGRCHCFAWGKHLVGDRTTGTVYQMSLSYFDDEINPESLAL